MFRIGKRKASLTLAPNLRPSYRCKAAYVTAKTTQNSSIAAIVAAKMTAGCMFRFLKIYC